MTTRDVIPQDWTAKLRSGPLTWGLDLATSEKGTSNPSSLTVSEKWDGLFIERLVIAWKTSDPDVTKEIVGFVINDVILSGRKWRRGSIDGTNEFFFATQVKRQFQSRCPIGIIKGNESVIYRGQKFDAKTLLGNLYVNAHTDGLIATPPATWIKDDRRLVKRDKGRFDCDLGRMGEHGDTFDSGKHAHWCQVGRGGKVEAEAAPVSDSFPSGKRDRLGRDRDGFSDGLTVNIYL